ncbi:MAG: PAS domain S-box protein [Thermoplasmata archaeon]|nr:PAS domain S-box protein [Thermoplasmata archaeon]
MEKTRILVVEDEKIVAKDIQFRVRGLGFTVPAIAATGEEAVEKARQLNPDLILMDIKLKGEMDGIEAAGRIREFLDIPIIFLTAYSDRKTLERAKYTEPFGYILKPFEDRDLYTGIEMAINKHRLDKEVRERERWLRTVLKSIADAVITTDTKGTVTFLNPVAEELTGWRLEDARGRNVDEIFSVIDERTGTAIEDPVSAVREGHLEPDIGVRPVLVSRDGREQVIEYRGSPIMDEAGSVGVVMVVFHDVTERRRAEKALMESLQTSADIVGAMPTGLLIFQREAPGRVVLVEANPQAEALLGASLESLIAKDLREVWRNDLGGDLAERLVGVLGTGEPLDADAVEMRGGRLNGFYKVRGFRMPGDRLGVAFEDVTERKRAEEMIIRALHEKEVLLKEIHHRVKNNLQIVSSLLHLQALKVDDAEARDMFNSSMNRIRTMALLHERLYRGGDLARIDLEGFVRAIAGYLFRTFGEDAERVGTDIDVGRLQLTLDTAIPCGFIINELLSNSLKHAFPSGRKGRIYVRMTQDGDGTFHLTVGDDGIGIPAGFDVAAGGSLGMQLVRSLVGHLDGSLEMDTDNGTEFRIAFRELEYRDRGV